MLGHLESAAADPATLGYFDKLERAIAGREPSKARQLVLARPYPGWLEAIAKLASEAEQPGESHAEPAPGGQVPAR